MFFKFEKAFIMETHSFKNPYKIFQDLLWFLIGFWQRKTNFAGDSSDYLQVITKKFQSTSKMSGVELSVSESFTTHLHNLFSDVSDSYIFCFHSINPSLVFPDLSIAKGQRMFFSNNYFKIINLTDFSGKYTSGCNVIIQSLDVPETWRFVSTFWNILFYIRVILIYLSSRTEFVYDTFSLQQTNLPLIKLVIYPKTIHNANVLNVRLLCNKYCKEYSETFQANKIRNILQNPVGIHKMYFWNSNQKVVQASIFARIWSYFEPEGYGRDRFACSRLVSKSKLMAFCNYEIIGVITLAEVHNISIIPYSNMKISETNLIDESTEGQYILTSVRYTNYKYINHFKRSGFQFSTYITKRAVYCLFIGEERKNIYNSMWLKPFRFETWIIIIVFLIVLPLPFVLIDNAILFDFLYIFGTFCRVAVPIDIKKRAAYVAASFLGFFLCGVYENVILSEIVQLPDPIKYFSLANILNDDYKIIWFNMSSYLRPEVEFENVFNLHHLNHLINLSFHEIKSEMPS